MAERRMLSKKIILSDAFTDMPLSTQALYLHLNMEADDDGFVNAPKRIQRMIGASEDDLKLLIAKKFVMLFESGVIVVKHWRIHNQIRKDRYKETQYIEEKSLLEIKPDGGYRMIGNQLATSWQPIDNQLAPQVRLGKDSIDKDISAEPQAASAPAEPPVISIETNTGDQYPIYQSDVDGWAECYPAVNVMQELRNMKAWSNSNPTKRKTKSGMKRFINNWLSREQNKGGRPAYQQQIPAQYQQQTKRYKPFEEEKPVDAVPMDDDIRKAMMQKLGR